jgi:hypothetical protein
MRRLLHRPICKNFRHSITMKTERGNFSPSPAYISIIESAAQKLAPSDERITDWHDTSVKSHSQRLALDLEIISKPVQKARKVLECRLRPRHSGSRD